MSQQPVVHFEDKTAISVIAELLKTTKLFQQDEFFNPSVRDYLKKNLRLDDKPWIELKDEILNNLKKFGYVIIKGLPFDENNRLFVSVVSMIGNPIIHTNKIKETVREIAPRAGQMPLENYPHTDSPHWPVPNDAIALQCKKEDQHLDVFSRLVLIDSVIEKFRDSPNYIKHLRETKIPFVLSPDFGDAKFQMKPILTEFKAENTSFDHVRFCRVDTINCVKENHAKMTESELEELEHFEKVVDKVGEKTQFPFKKNEMLIFDNKRIFHSKTKTSPDTGRVLKKIKINFEREKIFR